jgi:hypothetical protein
MSSSLPTSNLNLIQEIDLLWEPVIPISPGRSSSFYGRKDGNVLEIDLCGVLFSLERMEIGRSFLIATFPTGMGSFSKETERKRWVEELR